MRRSLVMVAVLAASAMPRWQEAAPLGPRRAAAQEALVLGGGGARGLAHAGVVAGLDSLGIDPGIVAGASMGAIIGALYASGREPGEIRKLVERRDWNALFAPRAMFVGPDAAPLVPLLRWPVGTRRPGLQQGLVPDIGINRELVRLLFDAQVRSGGEFDRMPRRFRVVATDLRTGEEVVLGRGDLARLVRASMAVPGVFAPVEWQGRWLVDGGIAAYLPIATARSLGAKEVIAADVLAPPPGLEGLSMVDLGTRALRMIIVNTAPDSARADYLIVPDIPQGMSGASFPRDAATLIRLGLQATLATLGTVTPSRRVHRSLPPPPTGFSELVVRAPEPGIAALTRDAVGDAVTGPYRPRAVLDALDAVYASGLADAVWAYAEPVPGDTARPRLRVDVVPSPVTTLLAAAGYDTDRGARVWAGVRRRLGTPVPIELTGAAGIQELDRWASAGARAVLPTIPRFGAEGGGYVRAAEVREFDAAGGIAAEREVLRAGGRLGVAYRSMGPALRALVEGRAEWVREEGGADGVSWGPRMEVGASGPDTDPVGVPALLELEARVGDFRYARARARGSVRGSVGPVRVAALADVAWVGDFAWGESSTGLPGGIPIPSADSAFARRGRAAGGEAPMDVWPALGGSPGVPGLRWGERRSPAVAVAGLDVAVPVVMEGFLRLQLRAGAGGERPADWGREPWIGGAHVGLVWSTPFGPLGGGVGYATTGDWRVDVGVGPSF